MGLIWTKDIISGGLSVLKVLGCFLLQGLKKAFMIFWVLLLVALLLPFAFVLLIPIILLAGILLMVMLGVAMLALGWGWDALTGVGQWGMNGGTSQMQLPWVAV